jgi:hypothetical protein
MYDFLFLKLIMIIRSGLGHYDRKGGMVIMGGGDGDASNAKGMMMMMLIVVMVLATIIALV